MNETSSQTVNIAELSGLKVAQLREIAQGLKISGALKLKKADLIAAIASAGKSNADTKGSSSGAKTVKTNRAKKNLSKNEPETGEVFGESAEDSFDGSATRKGSRVRGRRNLKTSAEVSEINAGVLLDLPQENQADSGTQNTRSEYDTELSPTGRPRRRRAVRQAGDASSAAGLEANPLELDILADVERALDAREAAREGEEDTYAARGRRGGRRSRVERLDRSERSDRRMERVDRTDRNERTEREERDPREAERDVRERNTREGIRDRRSRRDRYADRPDRPDRFDRGDRNSERVADRYDYETEVTDSRADDARVGDSRNADSRSAAEGRGENSRGSRGNLNENGQNGNGSIGNQNQGIPEEELIAVAGLIDMRDNRIYLRTSGYLPGKNDVLVPQNLAKESGIRHGDAVSGMIRRPAAEGEQQRPYQRWHRNGRRRPYQQNQQTPQLVRIERVTGMTVETAKARPEFTKLTPLYPTEQLRLETSAKAITTRLIDLVAPIGKGQRALIVSPPKAGKTMILQQIAMAVIRNNPEVHLMVVLVDERPEEVTDMERLVKGDGLNREVIASTFDRPASDHTIVAELAIERAKRLVEAGQDVVVLLDSITRLGRAYNLAAPASGRILSGGVDAAALYPPKKFFGAAHNIENGGSLTIIGTALVETGSKMDEVIFEEFKGTGNMELRLSRSLADRRIFPAVDVNASGTRREEMLLTPQELQVIWKMRRILGVTDPEEASETLLAKLRDTESNAEFLMRLMKSGIQAVETEPSTPGL